MHQPKGNNKSNRKRKVKGEKNTSKAKKVKKTPQNKTTSGNKTQKPPNPKKAEYQALVTAVKKIYNSFSATGFPSKVPAQPPPPSVQPELSSVQHLANPHHGAPTRIATPTDVPCTIQQQNMEHQITLSETAKIFGRAVGCHLDTADNFQKFQPTGGFRDLLQSDELRELREENLCLQQEVKMLRSQLKNQPGKE